MSEPTSSPQVPQNKQQVVPQGAQSASQNNQNPQGARPPHQNFQASPQQTGGLGATKVTPAWIYEIAMGAFQALIGLVLVFTGNQFVSMFGGGGYGSSSNGGGAGILFLLAGLTLIVAGVARPFKSR